jgi:hypothetical protein
LLDDRHPSWEDERTRAHLLDAARLVETDPHVIAMSAHLLAVARKPG